MSIVFDLLATQSLDNNVHGGGEYGKTVFKCLLDNMSSKHITAFYDRNLPIDEILLKKAKDYGVDLIGIANKSDIQNIINSKKDSTFYSALPYQYHNIDFHNMKVVITVHGLRAIEIASDWYEYKYAEGFSDLMKWISKSVFKNLYVGWRTSQFRKLLNIRVKHLQIIVPTQHTKYSILTKFPDLNVSKITVLYSPETSVGREISPDPSVLTKYGLLERGFILLVSGNRWVKNAYRGLMALEELMDKFDIGKQVLVVGGAPQRMPKIWHRKFSFLPYVTQKELVAFYKSAFCLLYPTLNEGFGYPPLEAMRHGTPVICSSITSTTEVLGDAPMYFSPYSHSEIENRVLCLVNNDQLWKIKSEQGLERYTLVASQQKKMLNILCKMIAK